MRDRGQTLHPVSAKAFAASALKARLLRSWWFVPLVAYLSVTLLIPMLRSFALSGLWILARPALALAALALILWVLFAG